MDIEQAAQGFAAIGSEPRLQVLLLLVKAGPDGMTVGEVQARTGMAASTLAHHLRFLASAGLIEQQRDGRSVFSRARFDHLERLGGYLLDECCADSAAGKGEAA